MDSLYTATEAGRATGPWETPPSEPGLPGGPGSSARGLRAARRGCRRVGSLPPSPGAAPAARGACGAVALLHDHADVGFHELGHVHHLPGSGTTHGQEPLLAQEACPVTRSSLPTLPAQASWGVQC